MRALDRHVLVQAVSGLVLLNSALLIPLAIALEGNWQLQIAGLIAMVWLLFIATLLVKTAPNDPMIMGIEERAAVLASRFVVAFGALEAIRYMGNRGREYHEIERTVEPLFSSDFQAIATAIVVALCLVFVLWASARLAMIAYAGLDTIVAGKQRSARDVRQIKLVTHSGLAWVASFFAAIGIGYLSGSSVGTIERLVGKPIFGIIGQGQLDFVVLFVMAIAALIGGWVGLAYWRSIDEAAKQAQKDAWFWGGSAGLAISAVPAVLVLHPGIKMKLPIASLLPSAPDQIFVWGIVSTLTLLTLCYGVAWAIWWWRAR